MMKKILITLSAIMLLYSGHSQSQKMTGDLIQKMERSSSSELIRVVVILQDRVDMNQLHAELINKGTSSDIRAKRVLSELTQKANKTQQPLVDQLKKYGTTHPGSYERLEQHWITNLLVVSATPDLIRQLDSDAAIERIEWDSTRLVTPTIPVKETLSKAKEVGSTEPGVRVINAPELWKMGYTGRGRLHYSFDTGAWPDHPAIGERFLGKHYPLSQSFFSLDNEVLKDKAGSHGTHTLGTALGLDENTNDTIGVAFNAYWIANDLIATSIATVKPLSEFVAAFEWAFNPDGDTATTSDIPDVINNSWGYTSPGDTNLCVSYVSDFLNALETAGIATVFSAGNDGPNPNTISEPHHINTGLVNVFTIGSINPHDTTYPISGFSSRGPTTCPGTGSLKIKPEVTAPGQDVRSANGPDGYGEKSGTSMASPHVSGALLLLKEAFPYLAGEDLMLALYYTARDLGEPGEDNTYGMGLIDVLAAFNWLAQNHEPVPPLTNDWDLAVKAITEPDFYYACYTSFQPQVVLENKGVETVQSATINYGYVGENQLTYEWTGSLPSGESLTIDLPELTTQIRGDKELQVIAQLPEGVVEADNNNNRRMARFNLREQRFLPYFEGFEPGSLRTLGWFVENPDESRTWDTLTTGGIENSLQSAIMPFFNYTGGGRQTDAMISQLITLPDTGTITLSFDLAYQLSHWFYTDSLQLLLSNDCGGSFPFELFYQGGADMTTNDTIFEYFVPEDSTQWKSVDIDLSEFAGQDILLNFNGINGTGNNLFIDNISIVQQGNPDGISENTEARFMVFPNPAKDKIRVIRKDMKQERMEISLINTEGKKIHTESVAGAKTISMDVSRIPAGYYLMIIQSSEQLETHKILIQR
jgi:bacillopeptidase F